METLRKKAEIAFLWSFIDSVGVQTVRFGIGVILARLLLPREFGLIGMLTIFIGIANSFVVSGFGSALIQKKELSIEDTSSVFYFNLVAGVVLAGLLWITSHWIASFYQQPILSSLTRGMSLVIVAGAFGVVQTALLTRKMDFKTQTKIGLISVSCSGFVGVAMAYQGFGVWSLVVQQLVAAGLRSVLLWMLNTWRPARVFRLGALRGLFSFGSKLLLAGLLNQIFQNIYHVVIGRVFTPVALGFYTRAKSLEELPVDTLSSIVTRVIFPLFSRVQDDEDRLRSGLRKALSLLVFINTPLMVGLASIAEPLVLVVFTEKWLPCVLYVQLLTLAGIQYPFHVLNLNVLMARGRSDLFLRIEVVTKLLVVLNVASTWRFGIAAMIVGHIFISAIALFITTYYTGKMLDYKAVAQFKDMSGYLVAGGGMGVCVHLVRFLPIVNPGFLLIVQVAIGALVYTLICHILRLEAVGEALALLRERIAWVKGEAR